MRSPQLTTNRRIHPRRILKGKVRPGDLKDLFRDLVGAVQSCFEDGLGTQGCGGGGG
jgi:hypothetical protein